MTGEAKEKPSQSFLSVIHLKLVLIMLVGLICAILCVRFKVDPVDV